MNEVSKRKNEITSFTKDGEITQAMIATWRRMYCNGATDDEFAVFVNNCKLTGLRPEKKQIYGIMRYDKKQNRKTLSIQISIEGLRSIANDTGLYKGQTKVEWCDKNGKWYDVWLWKEAPLAARVGIFREGFTEPMWGVAHYNEFFDANNPNWRDKPAHMLSVRAESIGLRKSFPQETMGMVTTDEMNTNVEEVEREYYRNNSPNSAKQEEIIEAEFEEKQNNLEEHEDYKNANKWIDDILPFEEANNYSMRQLAQNLPTKSGKNSRSYLHKLAAWNERPTLARRAKIALLLIPNPEKIQE